MTGANMNRRHFLRQSALWMAGAFSLQNLSSCTTGRTLAATGKTARPNILFCIADDATFEHMGAYGCKWVKTPAFDRVAREGILFSRAYTPNAKCAPSRSCIVTGRNSWQLEEAVNHYPNFPAKFKTYPEVLAENGYFIGFTGKGWGPGNPGMLNGRKRQLLGPGFQKRKAKPPARAISTNDYAANFEDFLKARPAGKPFLFWYGGYEPHRAYEYGAGVNKGGKKPSDVDRVYPFWPDNETTRNDLLDYAFEIEHFDGHLGRMLASLQKRGELDNTLVIVTADNGMPFPRIKGQSYEYSNHLPLAIMWKRGIKNPGRRVDDFVNFIDFAPTYLALAGIDRKASGMKPIEGRPLTDILFSTKAGKVNPERDHVLIGKERHDVGRPQDQGYPMRGIIRDGYLYLINYATDRWPAGDPETGYLNCDGSPTKTVCLNTRKAPDTRTYWEMNFGKRPEEELYHIAKDPDCMKNLAGEPALQALKEKLKAQLIIELKAQGDPRALGKGHILDAYPYSDERFRNFYGKYKAGTSPKTGWVNPTDFEKGPVE